MRSRTSKSTVALLVVIAVFLVRGTRRQRRLLRLLAGLGFAYPGQGYVQAVGGFFGGIGNDIKDYVSYAIGVVADTLQYGIDFVRGVAYGAARLAWDLYNNVKDLAWSFVQTAIGVARSLFDAANAAITSAYWAVVDFAKQLFNAANSAISYAYHAAVGIAQTLFDAANHLISTAFHAAIGAAQTLFDTANHLISSAFHAALDFTQTLVEHTNGILHDTFVHVVDGVKQELHDSISTINDYLFQTVQAVLDVVTTVLGWLVALASFPFTTARDMWAAFRQTGGQTILDHAPDFVDRWGDHIRAHNLAYVAAHSFDYRLPDVGSVIAGRPGGGGSGSGGGGGTPDRLGFAVGLLDQIGAPRTDSNIRFLLNWMAVEGTRATFNPLATTLDYGSNTRFNPVGVRNYADLHTGIVATAQTLLQGGYPAIVAALRAGDGRAAGNAHADLSRWSGGGYDTVNA